MWDSTLTRKPCSVSSTKPTLHALYHSLYGRRILFIITQQKTPYTISLP